MLRKGKGLVRVRKVTESIFRNLSGTAGLTTRLKGFLLRRVFVLFKLVTMLRVKGEKQWITV